MIEFAIATYGMLASFVMASTSRNRKERRSDPAVLTLFGWLLLSFSAASAVLLLTVAGLGYAGMTGAPIAIG